MAPCSPAPEIAGKLSPRKSVTCFRQRQQPRRRRHFGLAAARAAVCKKVQEPTDRHGIPSMGVAGTPLLDCVFACFRQQARIGTGHHDSPRVPERLCEPDRGPRSIHADPLRLEPRQRRCQGLASCHRNAVAEPGTSGLRKLARIHEQLSAAIDMHEGEARGKRRKRHITAANIQEPRNRCRIADHCRVMLRLAQQYDDLIALFLALRPAYSNRCGTASASGGIGRSVQTVSIGFRSTATMSRPAST